MVFLENTARKVLRKYVKARNEREELKTQEALWVTKQGDRLAYWGLNEILRRRSRMANVEKPGLHDFRRAFALNYLRNGGRPQTLQRLMGHADMQVLNRYLALTVDDLQKDHHLFSPVENSRLKSLCS